MNCLLELPSTEEFHRVLKTDIRELPVFPPALIRLLTLTGDEPDALNILSKIAKTDPGISVRLLSIVNSAFYGLKRKITSISESVIYLGFDEVKKIIFSATVFENIVRRGQHKSFDRIFFWQHCLSTAVISQAIAEQIHYPKPSLAYTCGLLHDIGKILFDLGGRVDYTDFIRNTATSTGLLIKEERGFMGMGHDDLGAFYANEWGLPDEVVITLLCHHRRYEDIDLGKEDALLVSIISLADFLSWTQGMGSVNIVRPPILQPEVENTIDFSSIDFKRVNERLDMEMKSTSTFYNFTFPSSSQFRENLLHANLKLSSINTVYYYLNNTLTESPVSAWIRKSLTAPHSSLEPGKIISATLKAIYHDFHFDRIYILKIVRSKKCLKVGHFLNPSGSTTDLSDIEIPVDKNTGGFFHCLRTRDPALLTGKTQGEKQALEQFKTQKMLIVPFLSRSKVAGILGMDNADSNAPLCADVLPAIAVIASELGMALEHAAAFKDAKAVSLQDGLTGLLNRLAIDDLLAKAFRKAVDGKNTLSLVMIDVDFFKKFNDRFGHPAGDNILKLIAATLKQLSRPFDHVGRYGGEEFIVILNHTDQKKALVYAERIRKAIARLGRLMADRFPGLKLTVSAGVSHYHKGMKDRDELISRADNALYKAKAQGRNRVVADRNSDLFLDRRSPHQEKQI